MKHTFNRGRYAKRRIRSHERLNEESANYRRVDEILRRIAREGKEAKNG